MLKNGYLVAKIGADTAENEQHFVEILPIGRRVAEPSGRSAASAGFFGGLRLMRLARILKLVR